MAKDLSRLKSWLANSRLQIKDPPLFQVITALIDRVEELNLILGNNTGNTTIENITNLTQILDLGGDGSSGGSEEGSIGPPGSQGIQGPIGSGGPAGPTTIGPMGINGLDGDDGYPIPGPRGLTGPQGIQGPSGPVTIGPMGLDGEDGEPGSFIQIINNVGGGGGSAAWELIAEQVAAGAVNYDFIDLGGYNEIRVVLQDTTPSAAVEVTMIVSIDNGASFLTGLGDYKAISQTGVVTDTTGLRFYNGSSATARNGQVTIMGFNMAAIKVAISGFNDVFYMRQIRVASALNAIRVRVTSGVISSGTIWVFGRA
jgi:hypothetical protein